jgi:hypothetical protein
LDKPNIIIELFDRELEVEIPTHHLMTISCIKHDPLSRFLRSEPLTKIYIYQLFRDQANLKFAEAKYQEALLLYISVAL